MNDTTLRPDDPKLTAYALGELSGDERAAVEAALRENPALRSIVEDVRTTAMQLEAALAAEPIIEPGPMPVPAANPAEANGYHVFAPAKDTMIEAGSAYRVSRSRGKVIRFPQFYFVVSGLAVACFAVFFILNRDVHDTKQQVRETEARIARQKRKTIETREAQPPVLVLTVPLNRPVETTVPPPSVVTDAGRPSAPPAATDPILAPSEPRRPTRSSFLENGLSLAEQSRSNANLPPTPSNEAAQGSGLAGVGLAVEPGASDAPFGRAKENNGIADTSIALNLGAAAGAGSKPPAPPVANPPGQASVASNSLGSKSGAGPSRAPIVPAADDEIVLLDKFTVSAEHLGTLGASSFFDPLSTVTRGLPERKELPRPPLGAQFARNGESYAYATDNDFIRVAQNPLSSFSIEIDTASYANVRRFIEQGVLPPREVVRIEELLNYFPYRYAAPIADRGEAPPFAASLEVSDAPWAPSHRLVRIGLKSREVATADRAPANLVFLVDVSAAMANANKLPLVKESMQLLIGKLRPDDRIAIVSYAAASTLALPSTPVARSRQILEALDALPVGGSANVAMGIQLAYDIAKANFTAEGINRVILCTGGDLNAGRTTEGDLTRLIQDKANSSVFLTVLGFGLGNYKDATLEKLAKKGNGNYGYIDTRRQAEKLLVEQMSGTLVTVAKDVKIQVEFNPAKVSSYRLIGYENRLLRREDFNNDKVDAGEIGAGHSVTALYEIVPVGVEPRIATRPAVDDLKYQAKGAVSSRLEMPAGKSDLPSNEMLTVNVRYKKPEGFISRTMNFPVVDSGTQFVNASSDFRFAAAVAQFGMILRDSPHRGTGTIRDVLAWAATAAANPTADPSGYRKEFIELVRKTQKLLR